MRTPPGARSRPSLSPPRSSHTPRSARCAPSPSAPPLGWYSGVGAAEELEIDLERLADIAKAMPANIQTVSDTAALLSTLLTRSAIGVLVFFLSQVLLGLYRYNARLEHYFTGRADALEIHGRLVSEQEANRHEPLFRLMNFLSAQSVDFGKLPNSPTRDAVDLATAMLKGRAG
jgi:hypothetical protein